MNYELSKNLEENGYPQKDGSWGIVYLPEKITKTKTGVYRRKEEYRVFPWHERKSFLRGNYKPYLFPTLAELIEACGDKFHCLILTTTGGMDSDKRFWSAGIDAKAKDWCNADTPQEAVAKLWLEINKK